MNRNQFKEILEERLYYFTDQTQNTVINLRHYRHLNLFEVKINVDINHLNFSLFYELIESLQVVSDHTNHNLEFVKLHYVGKETRSYGRVTEWKQFFIYVKFTSKD